MYVGDFKALYSKEILENINKLKLERSMEIEDIKFLSTEKRKFLYALMINLLSLLDNEVIDIKAGTVDTIEEKFLEINPDFDVDVEFPYKKLKRMLKECTREEIEIFALCCVLVSMGVGDNEHDVHEVEINFIRGICLKSKKFKGHYEVSSYLEGWFSRAKNLSSIKKYF